jgi:hypothetical protein
VRYLPQSLISDVPRIVAGLRVGQQDAHDLTAILVMLKYFLTDQLTLAVAIGCKPNSFGSARVPRMFLEDLGSPAEDPLKLSYSYQGQTCRSSAVD